MNPSGPPPRVGALGFPQDLAEQKLAWRVQRCGQGLLVLLLLAASIGVFGGGWLSRVTISDPSGALKVAHERLTRVDAPGELQVDIDPRVVTGDEVRLWIGADVLDGLQVNSIRPEPAGQAAGSDRVVYRFRVAAAADAPVRVTFHITTRRPGFCRGRIGVVDGPEVEVSRMVYP